MTIMTVLFIIATQALGLFLFSLFPAISLVISVVSMVGSLGATLSGVTFPVPNMYPLVRDASNLFPVRHFTEMMQTMLYGGGGFIHLWPSAGDDNTYVPNIILLFTSGPNPSLLDFL